VGIFWERRHETTWLNALHSPGKRTVRNLSSLRLRLATAVLPFLFAVPAVAVAQVPPSRAEATATLAPAVPRYNQRQLDQMLAPIALYPDQLLAQVLMASTYPSQIAEAARWLQDPANATLTGDPLVAALAPLPWDPSIKSLLAVPQVIVVLNEHPDWTLALGVAFANQQATVMSRVQALREQAFHAGKLGKTPHLAIQRNGPTIFIEPVEPDTVYVPIYNPAEVYGTWHDEDYPPVYLPPPPEYAERFPGGTPAAGIDFGIGYGVVYPLWGWARSDWHHRRITVSRNEHTDAARDRHRAPGMTWQHHGPVIPAPVALAPGAAAAVTEPHPPGTVNSTAVVVPHPARDIGTSGASSPTARAPGNAAVPAAVPAPGPAQRLEALHPPVAIALPAPATVALAQPPASMHTLAPVSPASPQSAVARPVAQAVPPPAVVRPPPPPVQQPTAVHVPTPLPAQQPAVAHRAPPPQATTAQPAKRAASPPGGKAAAATRS
jgi:uncharacterized protein DUF3300